MWQQQRQTELQARDVAKAEAGWHRDQTALRSFGVRARDDHCLKLAQRWRKRMRKRRSTSDKGMLHLGSASFDALIRVADKTWTCRLLVLTIMALKILPSQLSAMHA